MNNKPFRLEDALHEMEQAGVGKSEQDQEDIPNSNATSAGKHSQPTPAEASYTTASSQSNTTTTTQVASNTAGCHLAMDDEYDDIPPYQPSWMDTPLNANNIKKVKIRWKPKPESTFQLADSNGRLPGEEQEDTATTRSGPNARSATFSSSSKQGQQGEIAVDYHDNLAMEDNTREEQRKQWVEQKESSKNLSSTTVSGPKAKLTWKQNQVDNLTISCSLPVASREKPRVASPHNRLIVLNPEPVHNGDREQSKGLDKGPLTANNTISKSYSRRAAVTIRQNPPPVINRLIVLPPEPPMVRKPVPSSPKKREETPKRAIGNNYKQLRANAKDETYKDRTTSYERPPKPMSSRSVPVALGPTSFVDRARLTGRPSHKIEHSPVVSPRADTVACGSLAPISRQASWNQASSDRDNDDQELTLDDLLPHDDSTGRRLSDDICVHGSAITKPSDDARGSNRTSEIHGILSIDPASLGPRPLELNIPVRRNPMDIVSKPIEYHPPPYSAYMNPWQRQQSIRRQTTRQYPCDNLYDVEEEQPVDELDGHNDNVEENQDVEEEDSFDDQEVLKEAPVMRHRRKATPWPMHRFDHQVGHVVDHRSKAASDHVNNLVFKKPQLFRRSTTRENDQPTRPVTPEPEHVVQGLTEQHTVVQSLSESAPNEGSSGMKLSHENKNRKNKKKKKKKDKNKEQKPRGKKHKKEKEGARPDRPATSILDHPKTGLRSEDLPQVSMLPDTTKDSGPEKLKRPGAAKPKSRKRRKLEELCAAFRGQDVEPGEEPGPSTSAVVEDDHQQRQQQQQQPKTSARQKWFMDKIRRRTSKVSPYQPTETADHGEITYVRNFASPDESAEIARVEEPTGPVAKKPPKIYRFLCCLCWHGDRTKAEEFEAPRI